MTISNKFKTNLFFNHQKYNKIKKLNCLKSRLSKISETSSGRPFYFRMVNLSNFSALSSHSICYIVIHIIFVWFLCFIYLFIYLQLFKLIKSTVRRAAGSRYFYFHSYICVCLSVYLCHVS